MALCFGASVAVAQALHQARWYGQHEHWYWLPATAVFLVKPDLGPLASRVLCRAAGTVLGALAFAGFAAVLPRPEGLVALVALSGALIPVATRHFAAQTAVVTVLVLSLVMVGGEPQASVSRIGETLLACAIVLIVGHLPMPGSAAAAYAPGSRQRRRRARLPRARPQRVRRPRRTLDPAPRGLPHPRRGPRRHRRLRRRTPPPSPATRRARTRSPPSSNASSTRPPPAPSTSTTRVGSRPGTSSNSPSCWRSSSGEGPGRAAGDRTARRRTGMRNVGRPGRQPGRPGRHVDLRPGYSTRTHTGA